MPQQAKVPWQMRKLRCQRQRDKLRCQRQSDKAKRLKDKGTGAPLRLEGVTNLLEHGGGVGMGWTGRTEVGF